MRSFYLPLILIFLLSSCYTTSTTKSSQSSKRNLPAIVFSADINNDGNYEVIEVDEDNRPQPVQGKDQWIRDFYGKLNYPPEARENSISGIVILDIWINEGGRVTDVFIKKSLAKDCDEVAQKAYLNSTKNGYNPLEIDNIPVKFRMDLAVGFWLE